MRAVPLFPSEVTPPPPGEAFKRPLWGDIFVAVALSGVRGRAALALVGVPQQGRIVERTKGTDDEVTAPLAVVRALGWALDLLEPRVWRATLWTNLSAAAVTPELRRSLSLSPSDDPTSFRAGLAGLVSRLDASGSEIRWARTEDQRHLLRARFLAADAARRISR